MSDINVRQEHFVASELTNKQCPASYETRHYPQTGTSFTTNQKYEIKTGTNVIAPIAEMEHVLKMTIGTIGATGFLTFANPALCFWSQVDVKLNGVPITDPGAGNWVNDSTVSARCMQAAAKLISDEQYAKFYESGEPTTNNVDGVTVASGDKICSVTKLHGISLLTPGSYFPPNSTIVISAKIAPAYGLYQSVRGSDVDVTYTGHTINETYMNCRFITLPEALPKVVVLKMQTLASTDESIGGASETKVYQPQASLIRVCYNNRSVNHDTTTLRNKQYNSLNFAYATHESTLKLNSLSIKVGNKIIPSNGFDNEYGFYESHRWFNKLTEKYLNDAGGETLTQWKSSPLYTVPVVKRTEEQIGNISISAKFAASGITTAAQAVITMIHDQYIRVTYNDFGVPMLTEATL